MVLRGAARAAFALCLLAGLVQASPARADCEPPGRDGVVTAIEPGLTLVLEGGRRLRLADLVLPAWPDDLRKTAVRADKRLARLLGQPISFHANGTPDARGRERAQIWHEGAWVQADLVSRGLVRVAPERYRSCALGLMPLELAAAAADAGSWARARYWPTDQPYALTNATGSYQVLRGRVEAVAKTASGTYVNFGPNRWTDITALVSESAAKAIGDDTLAGLAGREVVLRGWVRQANGPMIDVRRPLQLRASATPEDADGDE